MEPIASFEHQNGNGGSAFLFQTDNEAEPLLLLLRRKSSLHLAWLDADLRLIRKEEAQELPEKLSRMGVVGAVYRTGEVRLYFEQRLSSEVVRVDLDANRGLHQTYERTLSTDHPLLMRFLAEGKFYVIQLDRQKRRLVVQVLDQDLNARVRQFSLAEHPKVFSRLRKKEEVPVPLITDENQVSLMAAVSGEKLYLEGDSLILTSEDERYGLTHTFLFPLGSDGGTQHRAYPYPSYQGKRSLQSMNAYRYGGRLYQAGYHKKRGLAVHVTDPATGEVLLEKYWPTEESIWRSFPNRSVRRYTGIIQGLGYRKVTDKMHRSLGIAVSQSAGTPPELLIGSVNSAEQNQERMALSVIGSVVSLGVGPGFTGQPYNIFIDRLNFFHWVAGYLATGATQYEARVYLDLESLALQPDPVVPDLAKRSIEMMYQVEPDGLIRSSAHTFFTWQKKHYMGLWAHKRYDFYEIDRFAGY